MQRKSPYKAIVIGSSAGGINALTKVLSVLPADFPLPIVIVQHLHPESGHHLPYILGTKSALKIKQADEKEKIEKGWVYLAPPNYHLLVEEDFTFSLSLESPVNYSRPSIDVLFESAIYAYRQHLIGIILTGANHDGSLGLKKIKETGGFTIVQDPKTAEADAMPKAAIEATTIDKILPLQDIGLYLLQLVNRKYN
jgi:two-component system chemotaxis response regulator CheB